MGDFLANLFLKPLENLGKQILATLGDAAFYILNWILKAAAAFFEGMLEIGFEANLDVVRVGWGIARDFSNMFFILILVIIAFGTILRIEQYGIKQLLPKVIIIALLINFSFIIAGAIIDFTNIAANFFIGSIRENLTGRGAISSSFAGSLSMGSNYLTFTDCEAYRRIGYAKCEELFTGLIAEGERSRCRRHIDANVEDCERQGEIRVPTEQGSFLNLLLSTTVGSITMAVAAFTLFAGGVLLLIRIIVLWFLVIVVPFVFICYITPGLRKIWQKWWSSFLSWCFFAPAYAFFVWIAIWISVSGANQRLGLMIETAQSGDWAALSNQFVVDPGAQLISYLIIIIFLIGGLIMAKQIGIYGATTVIKVGQRMAGAERVKRYMKARQAVRAEGKKEAVKRRLRLRESGGIRQAVRERMPGEMGRQARAKRRTVIATEAERLTKTHPLNDIRRIAGYRPATGYRRTSRIAAARALADEKLSKEIKSLPQAQREEIAQLLKGLEKSLSKYKVPSRGTPKKESPEVPFTTA